MDSGSPYIVLKLDTQEAIELGDFVSAFTSLASQYERYMRAHHPDLAPDASIFIREVRSGCIEADLIPWAASSIASVTGVMDQILIVEQFIRTYGRRLGLYLRGEKRDDTATSSDLKDLMDQVASIANDPKGRAVISGVHFEDGRRQVKASIEFDTASAQKAIENLSSHRSEMERKRVETHERVLMRFSQSNVKSTEPGKRTGERVIIPSLSDTDRSLIYGTDLAEQRIKHEIRYEDDNIYKKGFVVDVMTEVWNGKVSAYRVTHVHDVIDLDD